MKFISNLLKLMSALALIAGAVYAIATYGEQIVAFAKKLMAACPCKCGDGCCCGDECKCEESCECAEAPCCEEAPAEEPAAEEAVSEEAPAEEAPAEEPAEPVAEEADFEA